MRVRHQKAVGDRSETKLEHGRSCRPRPLEGHRNTHVPRTHGQLVPALDSNENEEVVPSRIQIFASADMRFKASIATELFADGSYRVVPRGFATLHTINSVIDGVPYTVFFYMKKTRWRTRLCVLSVVKRYLTKFDTSCVVHMDSRRSTTSASSTAIALFC